MTRRNKAELKGTAGS